MPRASMWLNLYGHQAVRHKLKKGLKLHLYEHHCRVIDLVQFKNDLVQTKNDFSLLNFVFDFFESAKNTFRLIESSPVNI